MKTTVYIDCFLILITLLSCNNKFNDTGKAITQIHAFEIDTYPSSCPFLTKDNEGNIVLSWTRNLNDSQSVVCYAVSPDKGRSFCRPVVIPSSTNVDPHAENMPKMVCKPSGEMIAVWGAGNPNPNNPYSGLVFYAQSFDNGKSWSGARPLVRDKAGYDQRYFDVAMLTNGEAGIIWLDNRKRSSRKGSAIYFASTDGNSGFQNEKIVTESSCECCRTDLFVDAKNNIHLTYRGILNDSIRDMVHSVSSDGGHSFSEPVRLHTDNWVIKGCPHTGPSMTENSRGLHFAWYTMGSGKGLFYCNSTDNGKSFSARDSIRSLPVARHPQIISLTDESTVIVWDETVKKADKTNISIALQRRTPEGNIDMTNFISADTCDATYPVTETIEKNTIALAYNRKKNDKSYVVFQTITFQ